MLHPIKAATIPMAQGKGHLSDIGGHMLKIRAAVTSLHHKLATFLSKRHFVAMEHTILLNEFSLNMEFVLSIDLVLAAESVFALGIVVHIQSALATSIAVIVNTVGRCITFVAGSVEGMPVGLLNVKFWAPVATNLIRVTVLERILNVVVSSGHENSVQG